MRTTAPALVALLALAACSRASTQGAADGGPNAKDADAERSDAIAERSDAIAERSDAIAERSDAGSADAGPSDGGLGDARDLGRWEARAPLRLGARQETAVVALDGKIYVIGGFDRNTRIVSTVEVYDPERDVWEDAPALPSPLHHANASVVRGHIFITGFLTGLDFRANGGVLEYDPSARQWSMTRRSMPAGTERGASATAAVDGVIYVFGGFRGGAVSDASAYDPASDAWRSLPSLPTLRDHAAAGAIGGRIYIVGGRGSSVTDHTPRLDVFDPAAGQYRQLASMPTSRGGIAAAAFRDRLYVFGGEGNRAAPSGVFNQTEAYDPITDAWASLREMSTPRHGTGGAATGDRIYVPGGATSEGFGASPACDAFVP